MLTGELLQAEEAVGGGEHRWGGEGGSVMAVVCAQDLGEDPAFIRRLFLLVSGGDVGWWCINEQLNSNA